jgi:hypothetical protein
MAEELLPKQELLIKLMGMTTSANDGEALVAVRKANELLAANKWSWEKLIRGKLKIIEDPFKNITNPSAHASSPFGTAPTNPQHMYAPPPPPPPRPHGFTPTPRPTPPPPPRYAAQPTPTPAAPKTRPSVKRQPNASHPVWGVARAAAPPNLSALGGNKATSTPDDIFK